MQNTTQKMKAMAIDEFGGADKLTHHTVPVPTVETGEVLIRVAFAGVGIWDEMEREGTLIYNQARFPRVLGSEGAGTIEAIGEGVTRFNIGDRVYAQTFMNDKGGSYAEYVVVPQDTVALLPDGFSFESAGGLTIAAATALRNLDALQLKIGDRILLWGASGAVGHVALQFAKRLGAQVFAVASGADGVEWVRELGADDATDGRGGEVWERAQAFAPNGFDGALVLVGGEAMQQSLALVKTGGVIAFPNGVSPEPIAPDGVRLEKANGFSDPELLDRINQLIVRDDFRLHVAQTFSFAQVNEAMEAAKGHCLGKIVLSINAA